MPRRSTVYNLDEATRAELDWRIIGAGFGRYADHAAWLKQQGHSLSEAALQRYGKQLRRRADLDAARASEAATTAIARVRESTELARVVSEAAGADPLALAERTVEMAMARLYELATKEGIDAKDLQTVSRSLKDSLSTLASLRSERGEVRKEALNEARAKAIDEMRRRPFSPEALRRIREEVYGLTDEDAWPSDGRRPLSPEGAAMIRAKVQGPGEGEAAEGAEPE